MTKETEAHIPPHVRRMLEERWPSCFHKLNYVHLWNEGKVVRTIALGIQYYKPGSWLKAGPSILDYGR